MSAAIYITREKLWVGEREFDWDEDSWDVVWKKISEELKIDKVRVVLGRELSFVSMMRYEKEILERKIILEKARPEIPFEVEDRGFDWREVTMVAGETWLQIMAVERKVREKLLVVVKKYGIEMELVTTIGVLLGGKTQGREAPVVIRWNGKESLALLVINGLVDLVVDEERAEDLMPYAKEKWGLAVNPEELYLGEEEFDWQKAVYAEVVKGDDRRVMSLPIY